MKNLILVIFLFYSSSPKAQALLDISQTEESLFSELPAHEQEIVSQDKIEDSKIVARKKGNQKNGKDNSKLIIDTINRVNSSLEKNEKFLEEQIRAQDKPVARSVKRKVPALTVLRAVILRNIRATNAKAERFQAYILDGQRYLSKAKVECTAKSERIYQDRVISNCHFIIDRKGKEFPKVSIEATDLDGSPGIKADKHYDTQMKNFMIESAGVFGATALELARSREQTILGSIPEVNAKNTALGAMSNVLTNGVKRISKSGENLIVNVINARREILLHVRSSIEI